ncbi:MAG: ACP S-malonyltransferase, partial [Armatimonadetes bacterium]|nr:ACP S-malonyltransferase [Armatimonadota bacterium]
MIAFVFPGQNSHFVGMGRGLMDEAPAAAEVLRAADAALGGGLLEVMFEGPEDALTDTRNQQPAIVAHSLAALRLVRDAGVTPDYVAGHSLGEYSALAAADVLDFDEAVRLVRFRGEIMARADELAPGAMAAVLGLEESQVIEVVERAGEESVLVVANYNCPGQVVISGAVEAVEAAAEAAKQAGAKRVVRLEVTGAFHSPLMQP